MFLYTWRNRGLIFIKCFLDFTCADVFGLDVLGDPLIWSAVLFALLELLEINNLFFDIIGDCFFSCPKSYWIGTSLSIDGFWSLINSFFFYIILSFVFWWRPLANFFCLPFKKTIISTQKLINLTNIKDISIYLQVSKNFSLYPCIEFLITTCIILIIFIGSLGN